MYSSSPGKCGPFCHPAPNFSFYSFICYKDKIIQFFVEIFKGEYEYEQIKSIIKMKYKIEPDIALQQDIFLESEFYTKKLLCTWS